MSDNKWISTRDKLPDKGTKVEIIVDVRRWNAKSEPYRTNANVGYFNTSHRIRGRVSITGYFNIKGIYFAAPTVLHPESVTF
jgi:hypothetical protein